MPIAILSVSQVRAQLVELKKLAAKSPQVAIRKVLNLSHKLLIQYGYTIAADTHEELTEILISKLKVAPKKKSTGGASKQKGAAFERKVCVQFSKWLSNGERSDLLWRSAMSGGRSTVAMKKGENLANHSADISATSGLGETLTKIFSVECKFYKDMNLSGFLAGSHTGLGSFWEQTTRDARTFSKMPMLVVRQNNRATILGLDLVGYEFFMMRCARLPLLAHFSFADLYLIDFDKFLATVDPAILAKATL